MRAREGHRHPPPRPGAAAGRPHRGARPRGRRVPADRDRPHLGRADRLRRLRVGVVTSPNGADEVARRARNLPRSPRWGRARPRRCAGTGSSRRSSRRSRPPDDGREFPRPDGKVIYLAAENSRRGPIDALEADFVPLYSTVLLSPSRRRATSSSLPRAPPPAPTPGSAGGARGLDRARDDPRRGLGRADGRGEAKTHDLDGLIAAVAEYAAAGIACSTTSRS